MCRADFFVVSRGYALTPRDSGGREFSHNENEEKITLLNYQSYKHNEYRDSMETAVQQFGGLK